MRVTNWPPSWPTWLMLLLLSFVILAPIIVGLGETIRAAFGFLPALGNNSFNLASWQHLMSMPGLYSSLRLTLVTGMASTAIALTLALAGCLWVTKTSSKQYSPNVLRQLTRPLLVPILAAPHAALAIGLAFLIAPSGWLSRLFSPWLTQWNLPPNVTSVQDLWGISLIFGLVIKELPFLWVVCLVTLKKIQFQQHVSISQSLGHSDLSAWVKVVIPQLYPLIRLPVLVVLVYGLSNVDMAQILGPNNPPTLAVETLRWYQDANLEMILPASSAALGLGLLIILGILFWELGIYLLMRLNSSSARSGRRWPRADIITQAVTALVPITMLAGLMSLLVLAIWSFTWRWSFPDAMPHSFSVTNWVKVFTTWPIALQHSLFIALASSFLAIILCIAWLEVQDRFGGQIQRFTVWLIYLPLLIPQIAFIYGLKVGFLNLGLNGAMVSVIWAHLLFVFPYVMLTMVDTWQAIDVRYLHVARSLGKTPWNCFWRIKIGMLLQVIGFAWAIGVSVSISQYLPTLMIGSGKIESLTTEAISLASGADRRLTGLYALLQTIVPLLAYAAALWAPRFFRLQR